MEENKESKKCRTLSPEHRRHISEGLKKTGYWKGTPGYLMPFYGKSHTPEIERRKSEKLKGRKVWITGKTHSPETREKIRQARLKNNPGAFKVGEHRGPILTGDKHWNWKGGRPERRDSSAHKAWSRAIYKSDSYKCMLCCLTGKRLHAHHILSWANYPDLRYDLSNGITFCSACHKKYHRFHLDLEKAKPDLEKYPIYFREGV